MLRPGWSFLWSSSFWTSIRMIWYPPFRNRTLWWKIRTTGRLLWPLSPAVWASSTSGLPPQALSKTPQLLSNSPFYEEERAIMTHIPMWRWRDSPTRSLQRLCDFISANDPNGVMFETSYFLHHPYGDSWRLEDVPEPKERDPVRDAMLAASVEMMADAFNEKIKRGLFRRGVEDQKRLEVAPAWAKTAPPLCQPVELYAPDPIFSPDGIWTNCSFGRRNILADYGNMWNY